MDHIGVTFAFEGWPKSGPTKMRATSIGDAWLVRQHAAASPPVWAGSQTNSDDELLVLQVHQPDDGAGVAVLALMLLLGF